MCASKLSTIGPDNGLSPGRCEAIIWTNAAILLIRILGTNFNEMLSETHLFSFKEMHFKMSSAKWRHFYLGPNVFGRISDGLYIYCYGYFLAGTVEMILEWNRFHLVHPNCDGLITAKMCAWHDKWAGWYQTITWTKIGFCNQSKNAFPWNYILNSYISSM